MKKLLLLLFWIICLKSYSQTKWYNPIDAGFPVVQNQAWTSEIGKTYTRLPVRAKDNVRVPVWDLSQNSAGLAIYFKTNAAKIQVRYKLSNGMIQMPHMPATGVSGLDLYAIDNKGNQHIVNGSYKIKDTSTYTYDDIYYDSQNESGFEYRLYLPLYNGVKWLEIGIPDSSKIKFLPIVKDMPIIVYGTSIAQGGCASRPGMGWTNIVSRKLNKPVINLAFSGNGPLEKVIVDYINEIDAALYIYDCLPNMGTLTMNEIYNRVIYGVKKIRQKHTTPILITEHIGLRNESTNQKSEQDVLNMNSAVLKAFRQLQKEGIKNIYYLTRAEINFPEDGSVDAIHPNDLGMQAYADAYLKTIRKIFSKKHQ